MRTMNQTKRHRKTPERAKKERGKEKKEDGGLTASKFQRVSVKEAQREQRRCNDVAPESSPDGSSTAPQRERGVARSPALVRMGRERTNRGKEEETEREERRGQTKKERRERRGRGLLSDRMVKSGASEFASSVPIEEALGHY